MYSFYLVLTDSVKRILKPFTDRKHFPRYVNKKLSYAVLARSKQSQLKGNINPAFNTSFAYNSKKSRKDAISTERIIRCLVSLLWQQHFD